MEADRLAKGHMRTDSHSYCILIVKAVAGPPGVKGLNTPILMGGGANLGHVCYHQDLGFQNPSQQMALPDMYQM